MVVWVTDKMRGQVQRERKHYPLRRGTEKKIEHCGAGNRQTQEAKRKRMLFSRAEAEQISD